MCDPVCPLRLLASLDVLHQVRVAKVVIRPRLLDLFCKAGGCTRGYQLAGFRVTGVDVEPQPNYCGESFIQADVLWLLNGSHEWLRQFAAIHASPPCQFYSRLASMHPEREYPDLIAPVRELLQDIGLPYVIENVEDAPLAKQPQLEGGYGVVLCGSMFGLGVERGYLRRHRVFETSFPVGQPSCSHIGPAVGVYGHGGHSGKHRMLYRDEAAAAMDIDWMTRDEMTQAIPPAYTEHIGGYLMAEVHGRREAAVA